MPEDTFDHSLEQLLGYPDSTRTESGEFVATVMKQVRQEQRTRKLILFSFGLVGALFGLAGALILSEKITWLFTEALSGMMTMQVVLIVVAALAFYTWIMNDDLPLEN